MLIEGKKIANQIQAELKTKIGEIEGRKPGLSFILVGDNPASQSYIRAKKKACASIGIVSTVIELSGRIAQGDLLKQIDDLNKNPAVDGILVQLPLPSHIDEKAVMAAIDPAKDVDGFHPLNVGKMLLGDETGFLPCTPHGIHVLLKEYKIPISGKHVVIVGRSNIVGKPMAAILMQKRPDCNATVTIVHSQSEHLKELTRSADILVAAIGRPLFIQKEMVKPKAAIIDVGINRLQDGTIVGDVDFHKVSEVASAITPVPGGVGPMTIAMLLKNTLMSFLKLLSFLLLFTGCQKNPPLKTSCSYFEGFAMTMPYHIVIGNCLSEKENAQVRDVIDQTFSEMHQTFDNWNEASEISRVNQAPAEALIPLSPPLQALLALCDRIVALTGGRFDPTIEPLEKLWRDTKPSSKDDFQPACQKWGWGQICIQNGILKKKEAAICLDLCAVSKGFCVDLIIERLNALGYEDLWVEWAGDIRAKGHHPENRDWMVQVDPGLTINRQPIAPIPLRNNAIATSSYKTPLIDSQTAMPVHSSIASATVIAPTCALADALATAARLFQTRKEAEAFAQEVVDLYPDVSFWILSHRDCD